MKRTFLFFAQGFCCGMAVGALVLGPWWLCLVCWGIATALENFAIRNPKSAIQQKRST